MEDKQKILKNRIKILKIMASVSAITMFWSAGHAVKTQMEIDKIQNQKDELLSKYEEQTTNDTMEYFRAYGAKEELETYNNLDGKENASRTTLQNDLTTASAMFLTLGATGYAALLNSEITNTDKRHSENTNEQEM